MLKIINNGLIYGHLYFHELNAILIRSAGGLLDFKGFLTCAFIKYIQVFVTVKERYYCYKLSTYCKKKKNPHKTSGIKTRGPWSRYLSPEQKFVYFTNSKWFIIH